MCKVDTFPKVLVILFFISSSFLSYGQVTFSTTGNLNFARWKHESQLLPDGRVLAFGGDNGNYVSNVVYNSAELYDPTTGLWTVTGSMDKRRIDFTSAILNDGRVLAIGGEDENMIALSSCELYDPATGTWSYANPMKNPRYGVKAVMLQDGRLLVAGGSGKSTEIYDQNTGQWMAAGDLNLDHGSKPSMVLLNNGRVLLTGGTLSQNRGEIYDPLTGLWSLLGNTMTYNRSGHSMLVMNDGNVLITGTESLVSTYQRSVEIYITSSASFSLRGSMPVGVTDSRMLLLDNGNVLVYGIGDLVFPNNTKCIQIYNTTTTVWSSGTYNFVGAMGYTIHKLPTSNILIVGGNFTTGNGATPACPLLTQSGYSSCISPDVNLSVTGSSICYGMAANVSLPSSQSGVQYFTYINNFLAGPANGGGAALNPLVYEKFLTQGTNVVRVLMKKSGCPDFFIKDTAHVNVSLTSGLTATITNPDTIYICSADSAILQVNPSIASAFVWTNGSSTTVPTLTVKQNGDFRVKVQDANGCKSPYSNLIKVRIYSSSVVAGSNETGCLNKPAYTLTGFSPPNGTWSGTGVSPQGIFDPAAAGAGTFTLSYKVCNVTANKSVTVTGPPVIANFTTSFQKDSVCIGGYTNFYVFMYILHSRELPISLKEVLPT